MSIEWRVYCFTEQDWVIGELSKDLQPSSCFNDQNHVINTNSFQVLNSNKTFLNIQSQPTPAIPHIGSVNVFANSTEKLKQIDSNGVITDLIPEKNMVAILKDVKPIGTNGGRFPRDVWVDRDLNTLTGNMGTKVSLSSNTFTLQPGKYLIDVKAPSYDVDENLLRLYNITDEQIEEYGMISYANRGNTALLIHYIDLVSSKQFKIQHRSENGSSGGLLGLGGNNFGFGRATGFGPEIYTVVTIIFL